MIIPFTFVALASILVAPAQSSWRLPVTIEVTQDVDVKTSERRTDGSFEQKRGTLYSSKAFQIKKGQRFQMIKIYSEGECRIRFNKGEHDLSSCPWLDGFADNHADIFKFIRTDRGSHRTPASKN